MLVGSRARGRPPSWLTDMIQPGGPIRDARSGGHGSTIPYRYSRSEDPFPINQNPSRNLAVIAARRAHRAAMAHAAALVLLAAVVSVGAQPAPPCNVSALVAGV